MYKTCPATGFKDHKITWRCYIIAGLHWISDKLENIAWKLDKPKIKSDEEVTDEH